MRERVERLVEIKGEERGRPPLMNDYFLLSFPCLPLCLSFSFVFSGGHGKQETRKPHYGGRSPHGCTENRWAEIRLGHVNSSSWVGRVCGRKILPEFDSKFPAL